MPAFARGLYETLITEALAARLGQTDDEAAAATAALRTAEAADRLALHIAGVVERAISDLPDDQRVALGAELAGRIVDLLASGDGRWPLAAERPRVPAEVLTGFRGRRPDGNLEVIDRPLIPLLDTALLTNSPGEPRVGRQVQAEIASADRIDVVMAFIRRSGIAPLREQLRQHVAVGRPLRVLTTVYTGSTEAEALDWLRELGADVRVSYDTTTTRLHAKAWLFHRESGFSTAYVGSSNLTHSAQVDGLEWNVRVSGARNRAVIEKIAAVFESYREQSDFEPYDPERFRAAVGRDRARSEITLAPIEIRLQPFQERLLEQIELARRQGFHRNLLVSATGTGKTVMAAVDYARLASRLPRARLLFVAHREEILAQSRATFAHALRDGSFGELWVGGSRPRDFEHVFGSIQSLSAAGLEHLAPGHFDVVIVDEFHHAAAQSYERLLERLDPAELLGLTATPERSDGVSVLHWFDDRISAELRLWDAIDQHRLTPFAYYGIADDLDLREIPWRRGAGYDVEGLTNLITASDVWARKVVKEFARRVGRAAQARALGFCVSIAHARYMARVFNAAGIPSTAIWADTADQERRQALRDLAAGRLAVVFSVDLFNEGVDVPAVDTLLMLRPTDSPLLFLQQLGRGLRKSEGKSICTVLDFVGQHRKEFRYDRRFRALLGGSRASVAAQVEAGFPFLPAGCHMELDRVATARVLESIRQSVPTQWRAKAEELRLLAAEDPALTLPGFLDRSGLELDDVYRGNRSWSDLRAAAGLSVQADGPHEAVLRRACGRLLHVDDVERLGRWSVWLVCERPPEVSALDAYEQRLLRMLLAQLLDQVQIKNMTLQDGADLLWQHPQVRAELLELFQVLTGGISHLSAALDVAPEVPLQVHARYTRIEILAAWGVGEGVHTMSWQSGVYHAKESRADLLAFTLDKTTGQFSPTTRYRDYAISQELIHWESQSVTRADSETGHRYQQHEARGSMVMLFARLNTTERAFHFLGPATYVAHTGEMPMAVTWRLRHRLPGDLYQAYAAAVA
jgi:superfamily II DNA or RNA helicase